MTERVKARLRSLAGPDAPVLSPDEGLKRHIEAELERIAASGKPVIVGPWLSEVGFELLYWVPFVRWVAREYGLEPSRMTVLSRGGVAGWYSDITDAYLEIFEMVSPAEYKQGNEERVDAAGTQKHLAMSALDERLLAEAARRLGLGEYEALHPSLMYRLFMPLWASTEPLDWVLDEMSFEAMQPTPVELPLELPDRYVATKFYFSEIFPDTADNRAAIARALSLVSPDLPIVSLDTSLDVDDHTDFRPGGRVITIPDVPPGQNLAIQTAIVQGAEAFIGTYGGFGYIAPLSGKPAIGLYSHENLVRYHMEVADRMGAAMRANGHPAANLTILPVGAFQALAALLPT